MRRRVISYTVGRPSISYVGASTVSASTTSHTHVSVPFGADHATRVVAVAMDIQAAAAGSVTIAGVSATLIVAASVPGFYRTDTSIWVASVPSGSAGNIVVTGATPLGISIIHVFRIINLSSMTPTATATSTSIPTAMTIAVDGFGVIVATEAHVHGISTGTPTWTGGVTQVATTPTTPTVPNPRLCSALYEATAAATLNIGVTCTAPTSPSGCAASFR